MKITPVPKYQITSYHRFHAISKGLVQLESNHYFELVKKNQLFNIS